MSQTIDEQVTSIKFDNAQFEQATQKTLGTLENLKKSLNLDGATKSLQTLDETGKRFSLARIGQGIDDISKKFTALGILGITTMTNLANRAVDAGITLVKSITIDPIMDGFHEYETQLNSVQTILANTSAKGGTLKKVNAALLELNTYSDKTIYNFSEMARNIGTFTAAGVGLDASVSAIKGIANLAAVSGSNAQQASTAMYQLSQAISSGSVKLQDWNSVVNAGMGGEVFQKALIQTARVHGVNVDKMIKEEGSFRMTLQKGWLTSKILTETLSQYTGDLTDKQLKAMGYTDKQIEEIQKMAKVAQDAATKVKTFSQLIGTLQEAVGSGWSQTWQIVFGDFEGAKKLFTGINDVLGKMIGDSSAARNALLQGWDDNGGRAYLIKSLGKAFTNLLKIMKPIGEAFEQIFPPMTVTQLTNMTTAFGDWIKSLKLGKVDMFNLKQTFKGIFAIFSIGWSVLKALGGMLRDLFSRFSENHSGLLEFTASIGEWLVNLDWAIKKGDDLNEFFGDLGNLIAVPIKLLQSFGTFLKDAFDGLNMAEVQKFFSNLGGSFRPLAEMGPTVSNAWAKVLEVMQKIQAFFQPIVDKVAAAFSWLGDRIKEAFAKMDLKNLFAAGNLAMQGGILYLIYDFVKKFKEKGEETKGLKDTFTEVLNGITGCLEQMQTAIKAATILEIAAALLLLAISVMMLSTVSPADLTKSLGAITVMMGQLMLAMKVMTTLAKDGAFKGLPTAALSLVLLAIAVDILASAVKKLADLSWEQLAKGLIGVGGLLVGLTLFTKFAEANKRAIGTAAGLILLAVAIRIMAGAVVLLGNMDTAKLGQGVLALTVVLGVLAGFVKLTSGSKGILLMSAGLLILSVALTAIVGSVAMLGMMPWENLGRGLAGMAGILLVLAGALAILPKDTILKAAGLAVMAVALGMIAGVLAILGTMSWEAIAKGVLGLAATLVMLAVALNMMNGAIVGAAALIVASVALAILAPVLLLFSKMSWEEIGKGLLMLAGVFVVLGLAGLVLAPVTLVLLGVAAAVLLLGIGVILAGEGLLLFAAGLVALAAATGAGLGALTLGLMAILSLIPYAMEQLGLGIVAMINVFAASGATFVAAFVTLLLSLLTAIDIVAPALIATIVRLILLLVAAIVVLVPRLVDAGMKLLVGLLRGIANNLPALLDAAGDIIAELIRGLGEQIPKIVQAGADFIVNLLDGFTNGINDNKKRIGESATRLADALIDGLVDGVVGGADLLMRAAQRLADKCIEALKKAWGIASPSKEGRYLGQFFSEGTALGIDDLASTVVNSARNIGTGAVAALKEAMSKVPDAVNAEVNLSPTITPVLDLTSVKKTASDISSIVGEQKLQLAQAYSVASDISAAETARVEAASQAATTPATINNVNYTQNNTSPVALDDVTIYRQTNNQISTLKEALKV